MGSLVGGVDFSSRAIHIALIPLDPDDGGDTPPVTLRCYRMPTEKQMRGSMDETTPACRSVERCRVVRNAMRELLAPEGTLGVQDHRRQRFDHEVVHVCVEEPFGASRKADNVMRELYGAILACVPSHIERETITTNEWRRLIWDDLVGEALPSAGGWKDLAVARASCETDVLMDEHEAEAYLIARACRARLDKAFAA